MIYVLLSNGDNAEAETPEAALLAARTLMDEAVDAGVAPSKVTASFFIGDSLVRAKVPRSALTGGDMSKTMRERVEASRHNARMVLHGYAGRTGNAILLLNLIVDLLHLADEYPDLGGAEAGRRALESYYGERDAFLSSPDADPAAVLP